MVGGVRAELELAENSSRLNLRRHDGPPELPQLWARF